MNCTVCDNPMITLELDQTEIDYCLSCQGIWLDRGELEELLDEGQGSEAMLESFRPAGACPEAPRRCPICHKKMEKVLAGPENQSLLLDRCSKGHGLWFDRGELHAILAMGRFDPDRKVQGLLSRMFSISPAAVADNLESQFEQEKGE